MNETISIPKHVFARLFNDLLDEFLPRNLVLLLHPPVQGPGSPIEHQRAEGFIHPQAPPSTVGSSLQRAAGLARLLARTEIQQVVTQYQVAEMALGPQKPERAIEMVHQRIGEFADWYCGNGEVPWRFKLTLDWILSHQPRIFHPGPPRPGPLEQLVAACEFQRAAEANSPLQNHFAAAANQLFAAGVEGFARAEREVQAA